MESTVHTFAVSGRTFAATGDAAVELLTAEGATAGLVGAAVIVATAQTRPVSREEAMAIGAQERAARDTAIANAHGKPIALPEPSPFSNEAFVSRLPTQAELDRGVTAWPPPEARLSQPEARSPYPGTLAPHPEAGAPPTLESRARSVPLVQAKDAGATKTAMDQCRPGGFKGFDSQNQLEKHLIGQGKYAGPNGDWQLHHLVEQGRGSVEFGSQTVQNVANSIYLPRNVHEVISARMSGAFTLEDGTRIAHYRDLVSKLPYDAQRNLGIQMVRDALTQVNPPQEVRDIIEKELRDLDRPELRDFCKNIPQRETPQIDPSQLQRFVDGHNGSHDNRLPPVRDVKPWDGKARDGTFLDIGNGQVVQHQGRGNYALMNVQRDLGGVQPPIGQYTSVAPIGQLQSFQIGPQGPSAPGMGMGIGR